MYKRQDADNIAEGSEGALPPSHMLPIEDTSLSMLHDAQRIVHPLSLKDSATALARVDLPIPGRPLRMMDFPSESEDVMWSISSTRPLTDTGSGTGPKLIPEVAVLTYPDSSNS